MRHTLSYCSCSCSWGHVLINMSHQYEHEPMSMMFIASGVIWVRFCCFRIVARTWILWRSVWTWARRSVRSECTAGISVRRCWWVQTEEWKWPSSVVHSPSRSEGSKRPTDSLQVNIPTIIILFIILIFKWSDCWMFEQNCKPAESCTFFMILFTRNNRIVARLSIRILLLNYSHVALARGFWNSGKDPMIMYIFNALYRKIIFFVSTFSE